MHGDRAERDFDEHLAKKAKKKEELEGRRMVAIGIDEEALRCLFKPDHWARFSVDLPEDARFVSAHFDLACNCFMVMFEHPDFDLVPTGSCVKVLNPWSGAMIYAEHKKDRDVLLCPKCGLNPTKCDGCGHERP